MLRNLKKAVLFAWRTFHTFFFILFGIDTIANRADDPYRLVHLARLRYYYWSFKFNSASFLKELLEFNEIALIKTDYWASEYLEKHPNATKLPLFLRLRYGVLYNFHKWHRSVEQIEWDRRREFNRARKDFEKERKGGI